MDFGVFRTNYWKGLKPEDRLIELQELENVMAQEQGRTSRTVETGAELDGVSGKYDVDIDQHFYLLIRISDCAKTIEISLTNTIRSACILVCNYLLWSWTFYCGCCTV
ncbi:MAG: hypothetical protein FWH37_09690 [Candidatus Bathyarchaeota archaeon]|nr:hypothetical protein [Candidatus Termiticorpusculum sp.]